LRENLMIKHFVGLVLRRKIFFHNFQ